MDKGRDTSRKFFNCFKTIFTLAIFDECEDVHKRGSKMKEEVMFPRLKARRKNLCQSWRNKSLRAQFAKITKDCAKVVADF